MPQMLIPWGKSPQYPLDRRLGGPESWSGCCGVEKTFLSLPGIEPQPSSLYPVTILTHWEKVEKIEVQTIMYHMNLLFIKFSVYGYEMGIHDVGCICITTHDMR
jgi:hypothetical protein